MRSFHPISPLHKMCFRSLPLWPRFALHYPTPMPLPITTLRDCDCPSPHSAQVSWKLLKNSFRTRYILFVVSDRPSLVIPYISAGPPPLPSGQSNSWFQGGGTAQLGTKFCILNPPNCRSQAKGPSTASSWPANGSTFVRANSNDRKRH